VKQLQQATLIYNPLAGPANLVAPIALVADIWQAHGWQVTIKPTQAPGHAAQLTKEAVASGHHVVLAAGGDGTLGEVANGLAGTQTVMAPLPVGTANVFARELCLPRPHFFDKHKLLQAADALLGGRVQRMDLGYSADANNNGRYWMLWAGTGADGYLVEKLEPRPKWSKKLGRVGYFMQALMTAPDFPRMQAKVEIDGRVYEDEFVIVVVSNCRLYAGGGVILSPKAKLDDGLFEVWLFRGHHAADVVRYLWQARWERHHKNPGVSLIHGRHVVVQTNPIMPCQTDGERAGKTPFRCEIKPGMLRLLVPETAPSDLFSRQGEAL
jgi:diacylglycerol kinase (ATP)